MTTIARKQPAARAATWPVLGRRAARPGLLGAKHE